MNIKTFKNWIKTELGAISGVSVYGYIATRPSIYPAVMISPASLSESRLDSALNQTDITMNVDIMIPQGNSETMFDALMDAVEDVHNKLRENTDGEGALKRLTVGPTSFAFGELEEPIYYARIQVSGLYTELI